MKRSILLADDSVTIQKVIELTFMDEDFEVRAVSNGDEALALLPEVKPDFVIADVHMPGANGYEVCRRAKQLRADVPVLLLVGTFEPFDENEARAAGADSFLKKPFDSQELLQRVQELLAAKPPQAKQAPQPTAAAAAPPVTERTPLPTLDFPAAAALEPSAPAFSPEPAWGGFDLGPTPPPFPPPAAAPEPFDREPSFALEPDPTYQVEQEPVFELEESATSFAVQGDVFGAPSELAYEEPQDRYLPEEPAAPAPAVAGFDWAADPTGPEPVFGAPGAAFAAPEPEPLQAAWAEPEPQPWSAPPAPAAAPAGAPEAGNGGGHLSDADVDRIARRVVELLGDKTVRDVAWEVIPDMAEVIIRDRLRELESQVE
ncbi:MAG TPA: response regulator [Thermoanaerobaculia bacterium]|jgi:CheY-like chemotaxis protein|nr:response regulator [Thermoanaerobaculia bacterium]